MKLNVTACINASKVKLVDCYLKDTKLRRRRRKEKIVRHNVGKRLKRTAKALVVSEPIVRWQECGR
jgi:hypothetical protein